MMSLVLSLTLVLVASILYVLFLGRPHGGKHPPSPPGLPVIGHLHLLGKHPHRALLKLSQKYGPLMKLRFGSVPLFFASNAAMASEFLKTQDHIFASRPRNKTIEMLNHPKDLILAPYGDYWRNLRMLCAQELLSERNMLAHQEERMREVSYLLLHLKDAAQNKEAVKLRDLLSEYTYNTLLKMIIGKAYAGRQHEKNMDAEEIKLFKDYKKVTQDMAFVTGQFHVSDYVNIPFLSSMLGSSRDRKQTIQPGIVDAFWKRVMQQHRDKEHADFLASLMSKSDNTKQHENQIKAFLQGLISAGTDATAITIEWAIAELLHHPDILRKVQDELLNTVDSIRVQESDLHKLHYLDAVIKETLRLHTPVPLTIPHMSMEDSVVAGYSIPKEACVYVNIYAVAHDPSIWEMPESFRPERFLVGNQIDVRGHHLSLIPFSSGRRGCPGASFGLLSIQLVLANLLHAFDWKLPNGKNHPLGERFGIIAPLELPLEAIPVCRR